MNKPAPGSHKLQINYEENCWSKTTEKLIFSFQFQQDNFLHPWAMLATVVGFYED